MQETKRCTKCGEEYPLTAEYWHRNKNGTGGFHAHCKACGCKYRRQYYEANADKVREYQHQYYEANKDKLREINRQYYEANADKVRERKRKYYEANRDKTLERNRRWREANPDKVRQYHQSDKQRERQRQYYKANPDKRRETARKWRKSNASKLKKYRESNRGKLREYARQYYKDNTDKFRERVRKWQKANPGKLRVAYHRRRARKLALPDTYTAQDWQYALTYFNGCCAVCGRQLNDLFGEHTAAMDHWTPLSSDACLGTVPENIVPLCNGLNGCNQSKGAKDPETWLIETYGTRKARQIMARIQAYFDSLGDDEDVA